MRDGRSTNIVITTHKSSPKHFVCVTSDFGSIIQKLNSFLSLFEKNINAPICLRVRCECPKTAVVRTGTLVLYPCFYRFDSVRSCFHSCGHAPSGANKTAKKGETMKNLTLSFWLALAAASIIVVQNATPLSSQVRTDLPIPTCPPDCPGH